MLSLIKRIEEKLDSDLSRVSRLIKKNNKNFSLAKNNILALEKLLIDGRKRSPMKLYRDDFRFFKKMISKKSKIVRSVCHQKKTRGSSGGFTRDDATSMTKFSESDFGQMAPDGRSAEGRKKEYYGYFDSRKQKTEISQQDCGSVGPKSMVEKARSVEGKGMFLDPRDGFRGNLKGSKGKKSSSMSIFYNF